MKLDTIAKCRIIILLGHVFAIVSMLNFGTILMMFTFNTCSIFSLASFTNATSTNAASYPSQNFLLNVVIVLLSKESCKEKIITKIFVFISSLFHQKRRMSSCVGDARKNFTKWTSSWPTKREKPARKKETQILHAVFLTLKVHTVVRRANASCMFHVECISRGMMRSGVVA